MTNDASISYDGLMELWKTTLRPDQAPSEAWMSLQTARGFGIDTDNAPYGSWVHISQAEVFFEFYIGEEIYSIHSDNLKG